MHLRTLLPAAALICALPALPATAMDDAGRAAAKEELRQAGQEAARLSRIFNLVHEVVAPSVVSIHTRDQVFNPFRGGVREVEVGEGSGFVFKSDGKQSWILTNCHVVVQSNGQGQFLRGRDGRPVGFDRLRVVLNDNREVDAQYVGVDDQTDLAVIRIPIPALPPLEWADSDQVVIGQYVVALGHPLGIGYSATFGNVSATDRSTGIYEAVGGFESFIQTDAAINPGNSGGPLVDVQARVVGVNANIVSRTGANIGLGFAIPSNLARRVAEDLVADGRVSRGVVGVQLSVLDADQAGRLGLPPAPAVRIAEVVPLSPAAEAGLKGGDVVLGVGPHRVASLQQFRARLATGRPGQKIELRLWREGKEVQRTLTLVPAEEMERRLAAAAQKHAGDGVHLAALGMRLGQDDLPGLPIAAVDAGGPAARMGLKPGDRVLSERSLGALRTLEDAAQLGSRREVALVVFREGETYLVRLKPAR